MPDYEANQNPSPGELAAELEEVLLNSYLSTEDRTTAVKVWMFYRALPTVNALRDLQLVRDALIKVSKASYAPPYPQEPDRRTDDDQH